MKIGNYDTHPAADVFPLMEGAEFDALVEDIKINGQREAITRIDAPLAPDGSKTGYLVLDGRNRLRACLKLELAPEWQDFTGDDPFEYVWSLNRVRRHLEPGQVVALRLVLMDARGEWAKALALAAARRASAVAESNRRRATEPTPDAAVRTEAEERDHAAEESRRSRTELARTSGVGVTTAQKAITLQKESPDLFRDVVMGKGKLGAVHRRHLRDKAIKRILEEPQPLPDGRFRVIVADPPWAYEKRKDDGTSRNQLGYPTMSTEEICNLDVGARAHEEGCVLWLWTTNAFMRDVYEILDAWGFEEKTILTWAKAHIGAGDWLRGQTEHCVMAIRGKPVVHLTNQSTLLVAPKAEHSRKPNEFYALVEKLCPGSKLELFAREARPGWIAWGAEKDKFSGGQQVLQEGAGA